MNRSSRDGRYRRDDNRPRRGGRGGRSGGRSNSGQRGPRTVEASGRTIEEALESAALKLRVSKDQVEWEVIEQGRGGFLGLGAREARIRAFPKHPQQMGPRPARDTRDRRPPRDEQPRDERREDRRPVEARSDSRADSRPAERPEAIPEDRPDRPNDRPNDRSNDRSSGRPSFDRGGRDDSDGRSRRGRRGRRGESSGGGDRRRENGRSGRGPRRGGEFRDREAAPAVYDATLESHIQEFLQTTFGKMGLDATAVVSFADGAYLAVVEGDEGGVLVGRKGETLDALQHIVYKVAGAGREEPVGVRIDVAGYRDRREQELAEMAKEIADRVLASGSAEETEPLRASERRIIHRALTDVAGVQTRALGSGLVKRISIEPEGAEPLDDDRDMRPVHKPSRQADMTEVVDYVSDPVLSSAPAAPSTPTAPPKQDGEWGRKPRPIKAGRRR